MILNVKEGRQLRAIDLSYVGMFCALMMIGANITSFLPFLVIAGVPITFQSIIAILGGALLGSRLGGLTMTVYMFIGLVGAPVFAQFKGGIGSVISPTFGFVLSFIVTAYVVGKIIELNSSKISFFVATFTGLMINYIIGANWFYYAMKWTSSAPAGFTYKGALLMMLAPLIKDLILTVLVTSLAYRLFRTVKVKINNN